MKREKEVVLGFSGGIDSTVAAHTLREQGYVVHLETLDTTGSEALLREASESAQRLGMSWHTSDVRTRFREEIIDYFVGSYLQGETPAPCTRCNVAIKWHYLHERMVELGAEYLATGHYVRIHQEGTHRYIRKAIDPIKDQSYYLWGVPQELLARAITPMGDLIKREVQSTHTQYKRPKESMGVCFLGKGGYLEFLHSEAKRHPHLQKQLQAGDILNLSGKIIGRHSGVAGYTVGQKRGLELSEGSGCVVGVRAETNELIVAQDRDLYHHRLLLREWHTPHLERLLESSESPTLRVKIRGLGRNPEGSARLSITAENLLLVELEEAAWAPALGQPVVIYDDELVIGGGYTAHFDQ